jgi:hypothetical protein
MQPALWLWIVIGIVGIAAFVWALVSFILWITRPMTDTGRAFLQALANDDYDLTYMLLAEGSKHEHPALKAITKDEMHVAEWHIHKRTLSPGYGRLRGVIITQSGQRRRFNMILHHSENGWEIQKFSLFDS